MDLENGVKLYVTFGEAYGNSTFGDRSQMHALLNDDGSKVRGYHLILRHYNENFGVFSFDNDMYGHPQWLTLINGIRGKIVQNSARQGYIHVVKEMVDSLVDLELEVYPERNSDLLERRARSLIWRSTEKILELKWSYRGMSGDEKRAISDVYLKGGESLRATQE